MASFLSNLANNLSEGIHKVKCEYEHKLQVSNFEWIKHTSQFNEEFIKKYNEESDEGYFPEVDVQYPEKLHDIHNDLPFLPEGLKIEKIENLVANLHDKTEYVIHKKFETRIKSWIS